MRYDRLRVAIVGTGRISDLHVLGYRDNPKASIVALCDRDLVLARGRAIEWGVPDAVITDDYRDILANPDVDLVEILLPHHLHLQAALDVIAAGKALSLQKPMCVSLAEADILVEAARTARAPVKIFENFIFYPPVVRAKALITAGAIGTPLTIRIKSNPGKSRTAWEVPRNADAWRQDRTRNGGGPLVFDDGHHKFALAWHFMGNPAEVHAFIGESQRPDGFYFDAPAMISFRFPGNRMGNLEVVYSPELEIVTRHYAQDDRVEITGSQGVIWINGGHGRLGDIAPLVLYRDGQITTYDDIETGWETSFAASTRHHVEAFTTGSAPLLTASQGREILRFALAAEDSQRLGRAVALS